MSIALESEVIQDQTKLSRQSQTQKTPAVAYLLSQYPMLSMIFVLREVLHLRQMGFQIDVASINMPDRPHDKLTAEEAAESSQAYHLKENAVSDALKAHAKTVLTDPGGYLRGLKLLATLGGLDIRKLVLNFMYFSEALMVGLWMARVRQKHLHVHLASQAATVGLYVKEIFQVGLSMTVHGPDEFYDAPGQYLAEKVAAADFICCISFFARSQLMKLSPYIHWKKLVVSRLGVDPQIFAPRPARPTPEVFEVICVGRLCSAKGQHILVEAIGQLAQRGRTVRLRVVGAGPDEASLKLLATDTNSPVIFEGAVNQDHIRRLYAAADAFCIASFAEGIPVVLMEAMAMEIPCVTTHITGIPELIRNGIDGMLVAPSDVEGLARAIETLMDDPNLRERISKNGRQRVLEHYDLRRSVERLAGIFAERVTNSAKR